MTTRRSIPLKRWTRTDEKLRSWEEKREEAGFKNLILGDGGTRDYPTKISGFHATNSRQLHFIAATQPEASNFTFRNFFFLSWTSLKLIHWCLWHAQYPIYLLTLSLAPFPDHLATNLAPIG